jgi:hypothetical protein
MKKKILYTVLIICFALPSISAPRVSFTIENRRIEGSDYLFDIYAEPSSSGFEVGACNLVIEYNKEALDAGIYADSSLLFSDSRFIDSIYFFKQSEYAEKFVALDILTINGEERLSEKMKLATLRFGVIDNSVEDSLEFFTPYCTVYSDSDKLSAECIGTDANYCAMNPSTVALNEGDSNFELGLPVLHFPYNNSDEEFPVTFDWKALTGAVAYRLQVSRDNGFSMIDIDTLMTISDYDTQTGELYTDSRYYWRIIAYDKTGDSTISETREFNTGYYTQVIALNKGWNMISSNIIPNNTDIEQMFSAITELFLIKNGRGMIYLPEYGINQILNWDYSQGYLVYMNEAATLSFTGRHHSEVTHTVSLNQGWNMVSVLRDTEIEIEVLMQSLVSSGKLFLVKNGRGQIYLPGYAINSIGTVYPGEGYLIYMLESGNLVFPED